MLKAISDITIAILVVNYHDDDNTINLIRELITESEQHAITLEINVLDNDKKKSTLPEYFPKQENLNFVNSQYNLGFAGGMNYLIKNLNIVRHKYALMLNPDIHISVATILMLLSELKLSKNAGAISPKIISSQGVVLFHPQFLDERKVKFIDKPSHTTVPSGRYNGAAVLFDTNVFTRIGEFDQNIFLYFDEWDYSLRMADEGINILYAGSVSAIHMVSKSVEDLTTISYYQTRNILYLINKRKVSLEKTYWFVTQRIIRYLLTLKFKRVYHSIKGIIDFRKGKMGLMAHQKSSSLT